MKKTILTISDGNGVDTDFKKWPFYLSLLTSKTTNIINRSVIGSSNEMMFMQLLDAVEHHPIDYAIIQWTHPQRLDIVADEFWLKQAEMDSVYHFNLVECANHQWWVTSASKNNHIQDYHKKYIKSWQATQRSQSYMMAASEFLKFNKIKFFLLVSSFKSVKSP